MALTFLAVDDEALPLADLVQVLKKAEPECVVFPFSDPAEALSAVRHGVLNANIAFLDIEMRGWNGLQLAAELKNLTPHTEIVFVTAYSQYALESYRVRARGYLMKPVTVEQIQNELRNIGYRVGTGPSSALLEVRCFGNFDVFFHGEIVKFSRSRSKELFAYLIYRAGASCTIKELAGILFEDLPYSNRVKNQVETFKTDMLKTLRALGCENVIQKGHNQLSVDPKQVECEYYHFLDGEISAVNKFMGEFMVQYSWAELTAAALTSRMNK